VELNKLKPNHVVFDPVMVAKGGSVLLGLDTMALLKNRFQGAISLITPNIFEAEQLLGSTITSLSDMEAAARQIAELFNSSVLVKGGHLNSQQASDVLYSLPSSTCHWFHAERLATNNTHGTGCSLSSAIASYLAQDFSLHESIEKAKQYLTEAIRAGAGLQFGRGHGPIDHFYFLRNR
jgi:hydroxymethylpyrimidine/phosphomethylpyrimidine kinase